LKKSKEITGNALRTYLYLVTHGPSGLRDVQRGVGLSTPSLASYHLSRLVEAGYVRQDEEGRYVASEESSTEILEGYVKVRTALVPQFLFFAVLFTILIAFFSLESLLSTGFTIYLITASLAMVVLLWYESLRLWRRLVVDSANRQTND
jgi:DNA-binding transcriptional ArsR family regulator